MSGEFRIDNENYRQPREPTEEDAAYFQNLAESVLRDLIATGKKIVFVHDIPDLDFNIRSCFNLRPYRLVKSNIRAFCGIERSDLERRTETSKEFLSTTLEKFPAIEIFDPTSVFCDKTHCRATMDDVPLYWNSDHLTDAGSDLVVKKLLDEYPSK